MTMHYVGQRIIAGYIYLKNTLFQKPTFEWVWRLIMMASSVSSSRFRSPHLSGYGDSILATAEALALCFRSPHLSGHRNFLRGDYPRETKKNHYLWSY